MHPPLPGRPGPEPSWRERLAALRNIPPLIALVWETSPPLTLAAAALRLLRASVPLAMLWVGKAIIDTVIGLLAHPGADTGPLWRLVAIELALAVLGELLGRGIALADSLLADRFTNRVSVRLMQHAARLDLASFEDPVFYDKLERARRQSSSRLGVPAALMSLAQDALTLASLTAGLLWFSPWLVVLLVVAVIPAFLGETHFASLAYSLLYRWTPQRRELDYLRLLGASYQSAKEVKIFGLGEYLAGRHEALAERFFRENRRLAVRRAVLGSFLHLVGAAGYYGAYVIILARTVSGALSVGGLTFLAGSFARSRALIESIFNTMANITEQALFLDDLFEFFRMQPRVTSPPGALPAPRPIRQGFVFENVSFAYPGSDRVILREMNLRIEAGERVALIGENGAGKTTLVKLLARLYDPTAGRILLDGRDLREYSLEDLRREIGIIFQDYVKYELRVRENIGFGSLDRLEDDAALRRAAEKSLALEVVSRLPDGFEQTIGRRFRNGIELSGGEWQKIALARAYLRDAQVLILDEPTASLDARVEYEVFQRFADLTRQRTAVLISHRFSTVRMADRIVVLHGGAVAEQGAHAQLLARRGRYAELFEMQAAGYR
jgi:ATP-binding cassette subfamily B protein